MKLASFSKLNTNITASTQAENCRWIRRDEQVNKRQRLQLYQRTMSEETAVNWTIEPTHSLAFQGLHLRLVSAVNNFGCQFESPSWTGHPQATLPACSFQSSNDEQAPTCRSWVNRRSLNGDLEPLVISSILDCWQMSLQKKERNDVIICLLSESQIDDDLWWLHRNFTWTIHVSLGKCFTRFPFFAIAFKNLFRTFHPKRSSKDSTDFSRLYRFLIRKLVGQKEILYQREVHARLFYVYVASISILVVHFIS